MTHKIIKSNKIEWWHFSSFEERDFNTLDKHFNFHELDIDDIRGDNEVPKLDVYKDYLFLVASVPVFDREMKRVEKRNIAIFIGKNYIVTTTRQPVDALDRFFARMNKSTTLRSTTMLRTPGFLLYKILDYLFNDANIVLNELIHEARRLEDAVYKEHSRVMTKRLGVLRRNILFMKHIVVPQEIILDQVMEIGKIFVPRTLDVYFDDVKDTLRGFGVVLENHKDIVDGLFDVNEAFLSHKMNEVIKILTVISVVLMPPTLLTGYYGMNVENLPFSNSAFIVSLIILASLISFLFFVNRLDRRE